MGLLYYFNQLSSADRVIYQQIYDGLCLYSAKIKINKTSRERAYSIYNDVLNDHPELAVVDSSQVHVEYTAFELWILPGYWFPQNDVYHNHMQFLEECEFIANRITNTQASDVEKEIAIHEFLCRNIQYGYCDTGNEMGSKISQSAFSTLFERKGVCKGISMLFKCLADLVGLKVFVVEGELFDQEWESHAWNIIAINGMYAHVDLTHDICIYQNNRVLVYEGLNFSDNDAGNTYRWERKKFPACNGSVIGFYEKNNLIVNDETQLKEIISRHISKGSKVIYFRIQKGSEMAFRDKDDIVQLVMDVIQEITHASVSVKYIIDTKSGKAVVEVE